MKDWFDAARSNNIVDLKNLLGSAVTDINIQENDKTALLLATTNDNLDAVDFLLNNAADANIGDSNGKTSLMISCERGNIDIVKRLIPDSNINQLNNNNKSAFDYSKHQNNVAILEEIKNAGGSPGEHKTVLIFGAGFTRAFLPDSPLLVDDYGVEPLLTDKYHKFVYASNVIKSELKKYSSGKVNLEALMTRLVGGMPYDISHDAYEQLQNLKNDIMDLFINRINNSMSGHFYQSELQDLIVKIIGKKATIITFNYDDVLDQVLFHVAQSRSHSVWNPLNGYGFTCKPSTKFTDISFGIDFYSPPMVEILKLHGSMNWRIQLGAKEPYRLDDIVNHSLWFMDHQHMSHVAPLVEGMMEKRPFIVPPILTKSVLNEEPILRYLWTKAYDAIKDADELIFVGYSLPITDIAAAYLFSEAAQSYPIHPKIQVVGYATTTVQKNFLKDSYRRIYPSLDDADFLFDGALDWSKSFT